MSRLVQYGTLPSQMQLMIARIGLRSGFCTISLGIEMEETRRKKQTRILRRDTMASLVVVTSLTPCLPLHPNKAVLMGPQVTMILVCLCLILSMVISDA
jgi:hypothetical protein